MPKPDYIIYADGGARGNPGPAATGFVVFGADGKKVAEAGEAIGETTNNVAEYRSVIAGLKKLKALIGGERAASAHVEARMDSELVVRQMNAEYKVKKEQLVPLFVDLWNRRQDFASVVFIHVPREENGEADRLVNEALDSIQGGLSL